MNNDEYADFFRICDKYADQWTSKNTTSIEKLFLQLLSYYVQRFHSKRFLISVQTRMPLLKKSDTNINRKLFCTGKMYKKKQNLLFIHVFFFSG